MCWDKVARELVRCLSVMMGSPPFLLERVDKYQLD